MVRCIKSIAAFARSRKMQAIIVCVAIGVVLSETAVRSLSRESQSPPSLASFDRVATSQPQAENSCQSFEFSFLNPSCSKRSKNHAARMKHRVATFIGGHSDASASPATGPTPFATQSEGTISENTAEVGVPQRAGKYPVAKIRQPERRSATEAIKANERSLQDGSRRRKTVCSQSRRYNDQCLRERSPGNARAAQVVAESQITGGAGRAR